MSPLQYNEVRPVIKSGDILAWSHRSWKTWHDVKIQLVRLFTQSEYSHVAVAWVTAGRVFAIEAVQPVVRIYPLSKLGDFYLLQMDADWNPIVEEFALSHVGEPYSQLQAIKAFFTKLSHDSQWECAELVIGIEELAGIELSKRAVPTDVVMSAQRLGAVCQLVLGNA